MLVVICVVVFGKFEFLAVVVSGCSLLASCCWVVAGGCSWLAVVVDCTIDRWCFFLGSRMYYFIVVDILFYCDVYIILFC